MIDNKKEARVRAVTMRRGLAMQDVDERGATAMSDMQVADTDTPSY